MNGDRRRKRERGHITAFYMETLFLAVLFVLVILALIRLFALSVQMSNGAENLTNAVRLSENAAEAVAASHSPQSLLELLDENGNARLTEDGGICAEYDQNRSPLPGGPIRVEITWEPDGEGCVDSAITVFCQGEEEPIYTLRTAVYVEEAGP